MVSTAFLLFTVSTLAAQISAIPTKELNYNCCEGKTHCFEKPVDYPQEEIDRVLLQSDLHHLHRIKRETQEAFGNSHEKDECVEESTAGPLYEGMDVDGVRRTVIQSGYFSQIIPKIKCRNKKICFASLKDGNFECKERITRVTVLTYNKGDTEAKQYPIDIVTGCFCAKVN